MMHELITVNYPPDFDGVTDIEVLNKDWYFEYKFQQSQNSPKGEKMNSWEALVQVAKAIIAQNERSIQKDRRRS